MGRDVTAAGARLGSEGWERLRVELQPEGLGLGVVRRWVRGLLVECGAVDDCLLVVSELVGNVVRHQGGTGVVLVELFVRHGRGVVEAELRHVEARRESFVPFKPSMERELLLAGVDVPVEGLVESGRGLLVVGLVAKQFAQEVQGGVLVSVWSHGCKCR